MPFKDFSMEHHAAQMASPFEAFAEEVIREQTPSTLTVLFGTDVHYIRTYANYTPVYDLLQEMVEFSHRVGVDLLALTGDLVDGNAPIDHQFRDLRDVVSLVKKTAATSVILSKGNHDDCSWFAYKNALGAAGVVSDTQWYNAVVNPIRTSFSIILDEHNPAGGYYAVDYPVQKIRAINLNTNDTPLVLEEDGCHLVQRLCGQWCFGLRERQLQWLARILTLPAPDWSVVFFSHTSPFNDESVHNRSEFLKMIKAFREGTSGTAVSDDPDFPATVTYDFTNNGAGDVLVHLCGHNHLDKTVIVDGIPVVSTLNLLGFNHGQEAYFADVPGMGTVGKDLYNSWDCLLLDKAARRLTIKRFGLRALDRVINL